jgi:hypothetical protein
MGSKEISSSGLNKTSNAMEFRGSLVYAVREIKVAT